MSILTIRPEKFLLLQCVGIISVMGMWLGLYWVYNPIGFFDPPKFYFVSEKKLNLGADMYLTKPLQIYFHQPEVLILGNSMAGMGFVREQFPQDRKVVNGAVYGSKPYTWLRILQNAKAVNKNLDTVYLMLDLTEMNPEISHKEQQYRNAFNGRLLFGEDEKFKVPSAFHLLREFLELIISVDGYKILVNFFKNERVDYEDSEGFHYYPAEQKNVQLRRAERILSTTRLFDVPFIKTREYESLRKIIEFSYKNDINLVILLPPYHVSFYQALARNGMLDVLIEWKMALFDLNQDLALRENKSNAIFRIFDFARYSDLTRDQYALSGQKARTSTYYYDVNHFSYLVGDKILEDIARPDNLRYSRLLTKEVLDTMLQEMEVDYAHFSRLYD